MRRLCVWLGVSTLFATACDQATGPAGFAAMDSPEGGAPSASAVKTPIEETFTAFNPCAGEVLEFHIREQLVVHEKVDAKGGIHFHFVINDKGSTAVGLTSGLTWHQVGATRDAENIREPAPVTVSFVNVLNLIGHGSAPNLLIHEQFHITINANGTVTSLVERSKIRCK
jgi:hypothetical protein